MVAQQGTVSAVKPAPAVGKAATVNDRDALQPRHQPLITVVLVVAAGIAADRYALPLYADDARAGASWFACWWLLAVFALSAWFAAWHFRRQWMGVWPLLLSAACTGAAWHHAKWSMFDRDDVSRYATLDVSPVCLEAVAREVPQRVPAPHPTPLRAIPGGESSRLQVDLVRIRDGTTWRPASGQCQLTVEGHLLSVHPGDRLRVFGQFSRIRPPLNPGEFDFAAHARADRQLVRIRSSAPESVTAVSRPVRLPLERFASSMRDGAKRLVRTFVGPDQADVAAAILLGARDGLTAEELEPYLLTGTIHVLVVSGMNVAILAAGLYFMMRIGWLPRRTGLVAIMAIVVLYALLAEFQPPVVRAMMFALLACIGAWTGRSGVAFNSLAATALVVLAINPADLFRGGPQLSFLAVAALIWIGNQGNLISSGPADPLDRLIAAARPWYVRGLVRSGQVIGWFVLTALVVWLVTLPLLLNKFHIASPVSVLISPILWPIVVVAMWSGFLMLFAGWLIPPVGSVCGAVCGWSLDALQQLVESAERLPGGHFFAPGPAWWWVLGFYAALLAVIIRGRPPLPPRWQLAALSAWILIGLAPPLVRATQRDALDCSFVAVGHGACVVMESPTGETLLYDAGSLGSPEYATQTIASYLWHRGIMRIDGIVISHADIDHYNAVPGLLDRFAVGTVYVSPMMFDGIDDTETRGPEVLLAAIRAAGVPIREVWSGDRLRFGPDTTLHVIHPPRQGVLGSDNANSITMTVEHAGRRILLPGDLESPGIEDVMAELPYDCDVLLAPHHGSRRSDPPGFAVWSTPNWVVISGGASADVRPVVQTYERAGANVMHTNERGMIHFSLGKSPIDIASWRITSRN